MNWNHLDEVFERLKTNTLPFMCLPSGDRAFLQRRLHDRLSDMERLVPSGQGYPMHCANLEEGCVYRLCPDSAWDRFVVLTFEPVVGAVLQFREGNPAVGIKNCHKEIPLPDLTSRRDAVDVIVKQGGGFEIERRDLPYFDRPTAPGTWVLKKPKKGDAAMAYYSEDRTHSEVIEIDTLQEYALGEPTQLWRGYRWVRLEGVDHV